MSLSLRIEIPIYFESPGKAPTYNWCLSEGAKATNNLTLIQMQIQIIQSKETTNEKRSSRED